MKPKILRLTILQSTSDPRIHKAGFVLEDTLHEKEVSHPGFEAASNTWDNATPETEKAVLERLQRLAERSLRFSGITSLTWVHNDEIWEIKPA